MMISGSVYNAVKMMGLNIRWQQRKENPNLPKGEEDPQLKHLRESAESVRKSKITAALDGKLKAGLELTAEELAYLKENNPEMYKEAVEIQKERKAYEKQLKACKSKEDVERLNTQKLQSFAAQAKSVQGNSNLSQGEKKQQMKKILKRMMAVQNEHLRFTQTLEYQQLPEEDEDKKAERKDKSHHFEEAGERENLSLQLMKLFEEEGISPEPKAEKDACAYSADGKVESSQKQAKLQDLGGEISVKA